MKNDIDSILNSMFRDGRLNMRSPRANSAPRDSGGSPEGPLSPAAREAEKALESVQSAQLDMAESLQKSIERMTQEARADMEDLELHLKSDGIEARPANNGGSAQDLDQAFEVARQETLAQVLGQEDFVNRLILTFKRPFVAGSSDDAPLSRAALLGRPGTGRRSAVTAITASLGRQGVLKTPKVMELDLAAYHAPGSEKLFVQDLYAALKSGASALVFSRYEDCHPSVLPMVTALFSTGSVPLPGRYAEQKGLLIEVGTALAPGAVSRLPAGGRYLFLLGDSEARLMGALGSVFVGGLEDRLSTGEFTPHSLARIAGAAGKELCLRAEKQLGFQLTVSPEAAKALAEAYDREQGAAAIQQEAQALYRAMSEEKLRRSLRPPLTAELLAPEGKFIIKYRAENVSGEIMPQSPESMAGQAELEQVKEEMSHIVGLGSVKDYILSLEDNFKMQQLRRERGLKAESPSMHMIFTGNPGTGKTTVARLTARYLKAIGALTGGQLVEVTRADLVGQYVGHTAPLTQKAIQSALGGVLFIDEAYSLYRGRDDSFGLEAIDALVKGMEDHRDRLVVILAGYSREMEEFLTANSGLRSRFPNLIEFPDYTAEELLDITRSIVAGKGYRLDPACDAPLLGYYEAMQLTGDARVNGNGRMARNKVEAAELACARRNMRAAEGERDLELLLPEDFGFEEAKGAGESER